MLNSYRDEIYDITRQNRLEKKVLKSDVKDGIILTFDPNQRLWIKIKETTSFHWFEIERTNFEKNYPVIAIQNIDFESVARELDIWIENIEKWTTEQAYEDPWEKRYKKYKLPKELSSGIKTIDFKVDVPFSESEKLLIQHDLDISKKHVQEIGLPTDRLDNLESKLDQLIELVQTENKLTWLKLAKEIAINAVVNAATNKETYSILYTLFGHLFQFPLAFLK